MSRIFQMFLSVTLMIVTIVTFPADASAFVAGRTRAKAIKSNKDIVKLEDVILSKETSIYEAVKQNKLEDIGKVLSPSALLICEGGVTDKFTIDPEVRLGGYDLDEVNYLVQSRDVITITYRLRLYVSYKGKNIVSVAFATSIWQRRVLAGVESWKIVLHQKSKAGSKVIPDAEEVKSNLEKDPVEGN